MSQPFPAEEDPGLRQHVERLFGKDVRLVTAELRAEQPSLRCAFWYEVQTPHGVRDVQVWRTETAFVTVDLLRTAPQRSTPSTHQRAAVGAAVAEAEAVAGAVGPG